MGIRNRNDERDNYVTTCTVDKRKEKQWIQNDEEGSTKRIEKQGSGGYTITLKNETEKVQSSNPSPPNSFSFSV